MQNTLGSHWRWRLLLLVALVLIVAGARSQAPQQNVMIVPGDGVRVVATSQRREQVTVMTLDDASGRFRDCIRLEAKHSPAYFRIVRGGTAVVWQQFRTLHIADLDAPHRRKSWSMPTDIGWSTIAGVSSDERFAVFQKSGKVDLPAPANKFKARWQHLISVVDLDNGQTISQELWASPIESTGTPNEFRGARTESAVDGDEPITASWKLASTGQWEPIESMSTPAFVPYQRVRLAESPQGNLRRLAEDEKPAPSETEVAAAIVAVSPSGFMLIDPLAGLRDSVLISRPNTSELLRTKTIISYYGISFPKADAAAIVTSTADIEVLDLTTGKPLATFYFGTHRKWVLTVFALAVVGLVAMWTWVGARERSSWWMFDASMAMAILPLAHLIWFATHFHARVAASPIYVFAHMGLTAGIIAGVSIVVGWYWTYGRGPTTVRWIVGGLLLCAVCAYLSQPVMGEFLGADTSSVEGFAVVWAIRQSVSIVLAGVVAILLLASKAFGWAVRDVPVDEPTARFSLASLIVATIGISMLIAVAKAASNEMQSDALLLILASALAIFSIGNIMLSLILSRSTWIAAIHVVIILVLLPAIWIAAKAGLGPFAWLPVAGEWALAAFLAGSLAPIAIASGLARCHGWRWFRATQPVKNSSAEETAREITFDAPQSAAV